MPENMRNWQKLMIFGINFSKSLEFQPFSYEIFKFGDLLGALESIFELKSYKIRQSPPPTSSMHFP